MAGPVLTSVRLGPIGVDSEQSLPVAAQSTSFTVTALAIWLWPAGIGLATSTTNARFALAPAATFTALVLGQLLPVQVKSLPAATTVVPAGRVSTTSPGYSVATAPPLLLMAMS